MINWSTLAWVVAVPLVTSIYIVGVRQKRERLSSNLTNDIHRKHMTQGQRWSGSKILAFIGILMLIFGALLALLIIGFAANQPAGVRSEDKELVVWGLILGAALAALGVLCTIGSIVSFIINRKKAKEQQD